MNQKLTENDILEKEFKKSKIGGYNKEEVDLFLDEILDDYEFFTKTIVELKKANEILRKENFDIKVTSQYCVAWFIYNLYNQILLDNREHTITGF